MKRIAPGAPEGISGKSAHVGLVKNLFAQNHQMNCPLPPSLLEETAMRLPVARHYGKTSATIKVLMALPRQLRLGQGGKSPGYIQKLTL